MYYKTSDGRNRKEYFKTSLKTTYIIQEEKKKKIKKRVIVLTSSFKLHTQFSTVFISLSCIMIMMLSVHMTLIGLSWKIVGLKKQVCKQQFTVLLCITSNAESHCINPKWLMGQRERKEGGRGGE